MTEGFNDTILIFCDGACSGNPGPGGWGAIVATPDGEVWEMGGSSSSTTNNKMELTSAIEALKSISSWDGNVLLCTDSVYVIRGATQWIWGWRKRGWLTADGKEVANRDLWEVLSAEMNRRQKKGKISWRFVRGHSGVPGNERCDELAVKFSKGEKPGLYRGPLLKYPVPIHDLPEEAPLPVMNSGSVTKAKPYSYLSLLDGRAERHLSWAECERRVKGRSGAKFKKAMSAEEEGLILRSWGVKEIK